MKTMTKLFGLGLLGAGVLGAVVAKRRSDMKKQESLDALESDELRSPVVVTEEYIVVTDAIPVDAELIADEQGQQPR
jgi:hypothetical protein